MTPTHRAFARAMACAVLLAAGPATAQSLASGKVNTGTPTFVNDQNVPLQLDATGALKVTGAGGGSSGGSVTAGGVSGSQAQAVQGITGGVPQNVANGGTFAVQNTAATPAGTNTIGNAIPAATTANVGIFPALTVGGTSLVGKASAGNLYGFSVTAGGTAAYLAILNTAAAPAAGAAIIPLECVPVPVNGYVARRQDIPDRYPVGVVAVMTSSCTTFTAVAPQVISLAVQ